METPMGFPNKMNYTTIYSSPQCELRLYAAGFYMAVTPNATTRAR
jgi:hypothetical protein